MENCFQILTELKKAILEGNIDSFKQSSKNFIECTSSEENQITLRDYHDDAINPIRSTNLVILTSKYNKVNILKYMFDPDTRILNKLSIIRTILPDDEDEEHHNAFYYAIRWCNNELLDTLINKWPNNNFASHLEELDEILSRAYEELRLKNVPLSNEIEIFVEQKLIKLRFFSDASRNDASFPGNLNNAIGRIELVLQSISMLMKDYSNQKKVDGKFLFVAKFIAQNIHILKQQLKETYDVLPWEEMEFCLIIFVSAHSKIHEINLFYLTTLNKSKLLNHLQNFAKHLEEHKKIIKGTSINLPKNRAKVVETIIKSYPEFEELYRDYQQIRDVYSLQKISDSIKLALSADPKEREGKLIITRVLHVIGENLKNTPGSPKLSNTTSDFFLLSLPKNTKQIIADLRDSLSHDHSLSKRIEIEENPDINFYNKIKNDVKKVGDVINDILFNNKIKTIRRLLQQIVDSKNIDDILDVEEVLSTVQLIKMVPGTFKMLEHERLENLLTDLSNNIPEKTNYEKELLNEINSIINSVGTQSENDRTNYGRGFASLQSLTLYLTDSNKTDQISREMKFFANQILQDLTSKGQPNNLKKIANLLQNISLSVESRMQKDKLDDVQRLIFEMCYIVEFGTGNIKWIEELREKLVDKDKAHKESKTSNVTEGKSASDQLTLKLSELKSILSNYTISGSLIIEKLLCYKRDRKIQAVVEMLVLDIMSILGDPILENNMLLLNDHTPLITGRSLRNYLAHDNAVIDVLSSDPSITVILNAENLTEENVTNSEIKIGKIISDDILKLTVKYNRDLDIITNQENMFAAAEKGNLEMLKNCVKNGADINARSVNLLTALHFAAKGPQFGTGNWETQLQSSLEIVKFILDQNVSVSLKDNRSQTPLHIAAAYGRQDIVEFLITEAGSCVDVRSNIDRTPLHVAAQNGHKTTVEILLKNKANTLIHDIAGLSPLHYAIENDHIDVVKAIFEKDVNVDINETMGGSTPLHKAAQRGNLELVNFLLSKKAQVNARTDDHWTPLDAAVVNGHEEVVNTLLQKGADVNARLINSCSTLYYAVQKGHEKIANILLEHGATVNAVDKPYYDTPLHSAAKDGYLGIVKTLLRNKANTNATTLEGITALHFAVQSRHLDIVAVLLEHENIDIHAKDKNNYTPLHYAAESGHKELAELLINKIGEINTNNNYLTTLHVAALKGHKDVVDLLIKNKAGVNAQDANGDTPLHAAAINGSEDIIDILIKNTAEVNARTSDGTTPLHAAARNGQSQAVGFLIKNGGEVNATDNKDRTPLYAAVLANYKHVVCLLMEHNAIVDARDFENTTPLHAAVMAGHKEVVDILIASGANVNIKSDNSTPLISAIEQNRMDIVEVLMKNKADVNAEGGSALFLAAYAGYTGIVTRLLLKDKASVNMRNAKNVTPLHIAAVKGHKKIVKFLIRCRADVECKSTNNVTPLWSAAQNGYEEVVKILIVDGRVKLNVKSDHAITPLHVAAENGHINVVKVLLDNKANINAKDNTNKTPIELAVANGHLKVVEMLLQCSNAKSNADFTLLHIASQGSNLELVKYLVKKGFDINAKNSTGSKPIHIAAREGYQDTVEYFLSMGLSINETDAAEQTLLHYAAFNGRLEVMKYLIAHGADINAQDAQGLTAMHIAANVGYKDVIEVLLKNYAIYNAVDKLHRTPLNMAKDTDVINLFESTDKLFGAVKRSDSLEVEHSIKAGAFVNAKNLEGLTPLHYAAKEGNDKVVNVLLKYEANPNVVGNKGLTPLHYAAEFSHLKIIQTLLSKYAVYNAVSDGGKTPSDFTDDQCITSLFKLLNEAFEDIKISNPQVVDYLNKITDIDTAKAVMCACDRDNRTLVVAAVHSNFSKIDQLKQISQGDLSDHVTKASKHLQQGNFEKALSMFESAWEKRKEILGSDNPGTLDIQTHIATVFYEQGDYTKALNIFEEIFQKQKKILGLNDKDTLNTRGNIALVLHRQGRDQEAFSIYQEVYQKKKEILGPDHSDTLFTQLHMALVLDRLGKYEEALNMNRTVFQKRKEDMGTNHPVTVQAQNNIAVVLTNQGKYEEAFQIYEEVYEKKKTVLGVNHADTLRTLHNIAGIFFSQHKYHKALEAHQEVLNIQENVLGPNNPDTLNTRYNMANILLAQGKRIGAYKAHKKVIDQMQIVFGPSHRNVLNSLKVIEILNSIFKADGIEASEDLQHLQNDINIASSNGDIQTVQRLLKDGADPNEIDIYERTPLHYAVSNGHICVVNVLLKNGADVDQVTNKSNTTLLDIATIKGYKEIVDVLLQHVSQDH